MKKLFTVLLLSFIFIAASTIFVSAAEIIYVKPSKTGVMQYTSGNGTVDQVFSFQIMVLGDTEKVLMQGAYDKSVVAISELGNKGPDEQIMLYTNAFDSFCG